MLIRSLTPGAVQLHRVALGLTLLPRCRVCLAKCARLLRAGDCKCVSAHVSSVPVKSHFHLKSENTAAFFIPASFMVLCYVFHFTVSSCRLLCSSYLRRGVSIAYAVGRYICMYTYVRNIPSILPMLKKKIE